MDAAAAAQSNGQVHPAPQPNLGAAGALSARPAATTAPSSRPLPLSSPPHSTIANPFLCETACPFSRRFPAAVASLVFGRDRASATALFGDIRDVTVRRFSDLSTALDRSPAKSPVQLARLPLIVCSPGAIKGKGRGPAANASTPGYRAECLRWVLGGDAQGQYVLQLFGSNGSDVHVVGVDKDSCLVFDPFFRFAFPFRDAAGLMAVLNECCYGDLTCVGVDGREFLWKKGLPKGGGYGDDIRRG